MYRDTLNRTRPSTYCGYPTVFWPVHLPSIRDVTRPPVTTTSDAIRTAESDDVSGSDGWSTQPGRNILHPGRLDVDESTDANATESIPPTLNDSTGSSDVPKTKKSHKNQI
ncbi:hypothetical protein CAEBREN_31875 [Caenorhabditis brenneri]|uniref:Uncharacterized protein n=1 Tax=Caenorhabditis brenneri TaxID=135651 RepID=G0P6H5_CAEBE|nr:hypothetical protein CAEBREN_31875 [Caenorhabditis brenneri]